MLSLLIEARGGMRQGERRKSRRVRVALEAVPAGDKGEVQEDIGARGRHGYIRRCPGRPIYCLGSEKRGFFNELL